MGHMCEDAEEEDDNWKWWKTTNTLLVLPLEWLRSVCMWEGRGNWGGGGWAWMWMMSFLGNWGRYCSRKHINWSIKYYISSRISLSLSLSLSFSLSLTHKYTHTHTHEHTCTYSHSFFFSVCVWGFFFCLFHTCMNTQMWACMRAHTHTHTHTHSAHESVERILCWTQWW